MMTFVGRREPPVCIFLFILLAYLVDFQELDHPVMGNISKKKLNIESIVDLLSIRQEGNHS